MKQLKKICLAMGGALLVLLNSCSKDDSDDGPPVVPAPTFASFSPTQAEPGATITLTGTNFTGATAVSFGGTAASSFVVENATTIKAVLGTGATGDVKVTTPGGTVTLPGFTVLVPKIDGYDNSNQVAADGLIAHWTFDADSKESVSTKVAEKTVGTVAYETGRIGKAAKLTGAYMIYPEIDAINNADALANFTVSMWAQVPDNTGTLSSLFQINGKDFQDIWGLIGVATRTNGNVYSLAGMTTHVNGTGTHPTYDALFLNPGETATEGFTNDGDGWALITVTYDGPTNTMTYWGNGVKLGSRVAENVVAPETLALLTPNKVSFGTFTFVDDFPDGQWGHPPAAADRDWASHGITATLDDVRVFNKVLTDAEILALAHLGQAGR
ncbi:IPT/TIG domain-containing protein [Flavihumibacter petaseus]|uniref:IPT/TIG domain-containing protein n=1 Tax=Flavihumibacter petaseus NBRC 106054 TaxID=1220578 RepID=A0A0E9MVI9_9BACT|nr:IPT/TIG domain-containing protein [Flavihumibacter petaseus]GAO41426.1 hypothetical protein FPE01S_01_04380 [Flavihumibacter petaseus NBRC 106054]